MSKRKAKKTKAEKRLQKMLNNAELRIPVFDDYGNLSDNSWQQQATEAFGFYMTYVFKKLLGKIDKDDPNPMDTAYKAYNLGSLAWNAVTDTQDINLAKAQIDDMKLDLPVEVALGFKELLHAMVEARWELYPTMDAYINNIEITRLPSGLFDLEITVSPRIK